MWRILFLSDFMPKVAFLDSYTSIWRGKDCLSLIDGLSCNKVSDLEKAGVKITVDGKTYGKGFQDPRRQFNRIIGDVTEKISSLDKPLDLKSDSQDCPFL